MQALRSSQQYGIRGAAVTRRQPRCRPTAVKVHAAVGANGKQSIEDMNAVLGAKIASAAASMTAANSNKLNKAIGKFVKAAAQRVASGKLKLKSGQH